MKKINIENALLILLFIVAAALRIYDIEAKNLWFDEIYSWKISNGSVIKIISETAGDIHPPLFYILLKAWNLVFSDSVISMRLLSVTLSLLSMFVLYRITGMIINDKYQRILILLLYAVSPLNIFYAQEVRMLSLNLLLTLTSVYYFIRYIASPNGRDGVIYCIATALSCYTHYFAMFILLAQLAYAGILYYKDMDLRIKLRPFFKYPAFAFAMFIPWLPIMIGQALKGQPWRKTQDIQQVATEVFSYFKDIFLSPYFSYESMTVMYLSHLAALFIILFLLLSIVRILNAGNFISVPADIAVILFFIPLALAITVSFRQSIVYSRYLSIIIPYLFILLVYFSYRFYRRRTSAIICIAIAALSLFGVKINFGNDFKNNDYRKVILYIQTNMADEDRLIVEPHFMGWSITYHNLHSSGRIPEPSTLGWDLRMQTDSLSRSEEFQRLWFVLDYSSMDTTEYGSLPERLSSNGYSKVSEKTFYLIPERVKVQLFEKKTK